MNYQYHLKTNTLFSNGTVLMTIAHEINDIGACAKCAGLLKSLSSHRQNDSKTEEEQEEKYYMVSSCEECLTIYVHQYDSNWTWVDETELELVEYESADPTTQKTTEEYAGLDPVNHNPVNHDLVNHDLVNHIDYSDKTNADKANHAAFQIPVYNGIVSSYDDLNQIPFLKLKSVFSEAEIQTLIQKSKKEKYIRQYYHRAKKKYKDFEEIFGIKLDI